MIIESVIASESSETDEAEDIINPILKLSEMKDHLNIVIKYVADIYDENISTYYKHLRHLHELINKAINAKEKQQKISSLKLVSV